jgi:hypothetical protein
LSLVILGGARNLLELGERTRLRPSGREYIRHRLKSDAR